MKLLLLSNGNLAKEMCQAMERFYAKPAIDIIGLNDLNLKAFQDDLKSYLRQTPEDVLMICDFFGSAAFNEASYFVRRYGLADRTAILCGMNLPMIFKIYGLKDVWSLKEIRSLYEDADSEGTADLHLYHARVGLV